MHDGLVLCESLRGRSAPSRVRVLAVRRTPLTPERGGARSYALNRDSTTVRKGWQASGETRLPGTRLPALLVRYYGPPLDAGHGPEPEGAPPRRPVGVFHVSITTPKSFPGLPEGGWQRSTGRQLAIQ